MTVAGLVLAALAALLHVYIFVMESITWTSPGTRRVFGTTEEEALATRSMALNQGFYNLFLALEVAVGIVLHVVGHEDLGVALVLAGVGSMLAAALVLVVSSPDKASAAVKQGAFPLVAVVLLVLGLI